MIFQNTWFARFARKNEITAQMLANAVSAIENGKADANLGDGLFKQRVARSGQGKSGSFRVLVILKAGDHAFFVHGFAKSDKANISRAEEKVLKQLARAVLGYTAAELAQAVAQGVFIPVDRSPKEENSENL